MPTQTPPQTTHNQSDRRGRQWSEDATLEQILEQPNDVLKREENALQTDIDMIDLNLDTRGMEWDAGRYPDYPLWSNRARLSRVYKAKALREVRYAIWVRERDSKIHNESRASVVLAELLSELDGYEFGEPDDGDLRAAIRKAKKLTGK
jgi:hypothetical protein